MLYDLRLRHLASVFVDAASVYPTPHDITELMKLLGGEFLPLSVQEQGPVGSVQRMGFHAPQTGWQVFLLAERFNVVQSPTDARGSNMVDFADFSLAAASKLNALLGYFGRKAYRLAAVQEGLLPELTDEHVHRILRKLVCLPPTFEAQPPFEWDWRIASQIPRRVAEATEATNTILTARRIAGTLHPPTGEQVDFARIRVDIDINTVPGNTTARFGQREVTAFFDDVTGWHSELAREFLAFVDQEVVDEYDR